MGNQESTLSAKQRSYYSVEYLNNNQDLDFTKLENFTTRTYLDHMNTASLSDNLRHLDIETPGHDPLLRSSSQNLVGLVRNGAVLVQRSKSYVRPENKVLPAEFPSRPLKQTNLLKTEGHKRTWRNTRRASLMNPVIPFSDSAFDESQVVISPSLIKSMLASQSTQDVFDSSKHAGSIGKEQCTGGDVERVDIIGLDRWVLSKCYSRYTEDWGNKGKE